MTTKFKAIGFDWGGVISVIPGKPFSEAAADFLNISVSEFQQAYFLHNALFNKGKDSYAEGTNAWRLILQELQKEKALPSFIDFVQQRPSAQMDQRFIPLIHHLRKNAFRVGLLSNNSIDGSAHVRKMTDLESLFDTVLFSVEIGFMKPEPEAFQLLADRLHVNTNEMIFIDDSIRSLSTSDELGYRPILYKGFDDLLSQFQTLNVLSSQDIQALPQTAIPPFTIS